MGAEANNPLNIFSCYASEDQHWYQQLDGHLSSLQQQNLIRLWDESKISAGRDWRTEWLNLFNNADIILLFISPDFLKSRYQDIEDVLALQKTGMVRVIPLLIRPVRTQQAYVISVFCRHASLLVSSSYWGHAQTTPCVPLNCSIPIVSTPYQT
jgi:hypothetical protein